MMPRRLPFLFWTLFALCFAVSAAAVDQDIHYEFSVEPMAPIIEKYILDMTGLTCDNSRVQEHPDDLECCNRAVRQAANELERAAIKKGLWDSIKGTFKLGKEVIKAILLPELEAIGKAVEAGDIAIKMLDSANVQEFIGKMGEYGSGKLGSQALKNIGGDALDQKLGSEIAKLIYKEGYEVFKKEVLGKTGERWTETTMTAWTPCPPVIVRTLLKEAPDIKGFQLNISVSGNCACQYPPQYPMKEWFVLGRVRLTPHVTFDKDSMTLKIRYEATEKPEYKVEANCNCQKPEYGLLIPDRWNSGGQFAGYLPGSLVYDQGQWCSYMAPPSFPVPPDEPRDVPIPPAADEPRDVPVPGPTPTPRPPISEEPREPPTSIPRPPEETPKPPDSKPPEEVPPPSLTIKAKSNVLQEGHTKVETMKGVLVKLNIAVPALPIAGNQRVETVPADAEPMQGVTGDNGEVIIQTTALPVANKPALAGGNPSVEIDATPKESTIVGIQPDASKSDSLNPKTYLNKNLYSYITNSYPTETALIAVLFYPKTLSSQVANWIQSSSNILFTEINFCRDKQEQPGDPYFLSKGSWKQKYDDQWAIKRIGFTQEAGSAWELVKQHNPVTVAIIDTGLDWNHEDISWKQIWKNEKEIADNGIDDDKNGYVDDLIGWNFVASNNLPWDDDGHGTFVTGVIAAGTGNGIGIRGINPDARIMVLKALNGFGHSRASFLAEAILYAANNGARVINISVGGKNLTRTEQIAIDYAHKKDVVVIVAAGNEATDIANYGPSGANHVIAVAASDFDNKPAGYSNWGAAIGITAPGNDVLSLRARATDLMRDIPDVNYKAGDAYVGAGKRYYRASGTSFAAPIVTGVASLLLSDRPQLTSEQVRRILLQSATDIDIAGIDQLTGYGLLNATAALKADPNYFITAEIGTVNVVMDGSRQLVQVSGTADADRFSKTWIEIGAGDIPTTWKRVTQEQTQRIKDAVLGAIAAEEFQGATRWVIRLIVSHQNGNTREARFLLRLE